MTEFSYISGYIYPLGDEEYKCLNDVDFFGNDIVNPPFYFEWMKGNKYLIWAQSSSVGIEKHEFGYSRELSSHEYNSIVHKFASEFPEVNFDASKFKFIEYCSADDPKEDYYLTPNTTEKGTHIRDFLCDLKRCMERHSVCRICDVGCEGNLGFVTNSGDEVVLFGENLSTTVDDIERQIQSLG